MPELLSRLALLGAAALLAYIGYTVIQVGRTVSAVSSDPLRDVQLVPFAPQEEAERRPGIAGSIARGERVNVLLLGYGGAGHDGAFLTDSLMLASIDPRGQTTTLLSIPRDLWVAIPASKFEGSFQSRVNAAFAVGANRKDRDEGMRIAAATLSPILGVTIDRTVALDFRAFRSVVDLIGGVDLTVERGFTSLYPRNDNSQIDDAWINVSFKAGSQHMDGETALRFARARYGDGIEGTDYARSARQQKVILAARDKIVSTNAASKLLGLLDTLRENVRTDLSLSDMSALSDFARSYDDTRTVRGAITSSNVLQGYGLAVGDGIASTLQPRIAGWGQVQAYVRRLTRFPESLQEDAVVRVRAKRAATAEAAVLLLTQLGLTARYEPATDEDPPTTIVTGGPPATAGFVSSFFGIEGGATSGDLVVRLGRDWIPPRPFVPALDLAAPRPTSG